MIYPISFIVKIIMNKRNVTENLGNIFKSVDMFGSAVGFKVKGRSVFKTAIGAIMSILILATVGTYGLVKFTKMYNKLDTSFQSSVDKQETSQNYTFGETEFFISF